MRKSFPLRRLLADAGKLALSAGLIWMGMDLAQAQTPATAPTLAMVAAVPASHATIDAAALYGTHCASCHGFDHCDAEVFEAFGMRVDVLAESTAMPKDAGRGQCGAYQRSRCVEMHADSVTDRLAANSQRIVAAVCIGAAHQFQLPPVGTLLFERNERM